MPKQSRKYLIFWNLFVEYDTEKDKAAARRKAQIDHRQGVPFAVINGKGIHCYLERAYINALKFE
jgi:hypothetical protein